MRMGGVALIACAMLAGEASAQTGAMPCPSLPAMLTNGQALAEGWQVWIEGATAAHVEMWTNGMAFFLPNVSGSAAATELQCVARVPIGSGEVVTVEARKALDGRYRCGFAKGVFTCKR